MSWHPLLKLIDVNNAYIAKGQLSFGTSQGWWTDTGTFPSLAHANELATQGTLLFSDIARKP